MTTNHFNASRNVNFANAIDAITPKGFSLLQVPRREDGLAG
jgi:hypothetical protein